MSGAKRFYKTVDIAPDGTGFAVTLDGRAVKTPAKHKLIAPNAHIAKLIAAEWDAQTDKIKPETMPVTRLVNVALEITPGRRPALLDEAVKYAGTDLLSYRAAEPESLRAAQDKAFTEILDWLKQTHDIDLKITDAVLVTQDDAQTEKFRPLFDAYDDLFLTLALHLTGVYSSAGLALAVMQGRFGADEALHRSRTDELYQISRWGEDEEAAARAAFIREETLALARVLEG